MRQGEPYKLVGNSAATQTLQRLILQVASRFTTALIRGESGTGKELVARVIHHCSNRVQGPFVAVNCAAIPLELLESELFGHEKGAFTGAFIARQGKFELAAGGTLFLDEIGDMPISMQAKLLRVLQERSFERVGGNKAIKADVRIIAATHKNLEECLVQGVFREDLYYRLNVFPIEISPLRERREDIKVLIQYFIDLHKEESGSSIKLTEETLSFLEEYDWPGNVRELSNLIERLCVLYSEDAITPQNLPEQFFRKTSRLNDKKSTIVTTDMLAKEKYFDLKEHLSQLEFDLITQALNDCQGVVARAAKRLGLRRTTLVEKMKKHGLGRAAFY
jgi:sigma-54 specific flagellar transcriptional regulator A